MANIKSAAKKARQAIVRRNRNQSTKKSIRSLEKKLRQAISSKDKSAESLFREYESQLGKAAQKGKFHLNTAARKLSRLATSMNKATGK